jgi:hypothetical protein
MALRVTWHCPYLLWYFGLAAYMQFPVKPGASAAKNLVNRSKVVARRTTAHHAVHTNVKVLSLNPHGPPDWWVDNKKAACEEKILSVPATDPK